MAVILFVKDDGYGLTSFDANPQAENRDMKYFNIVLVTLVCLLPLNVATAASAAGVLFETEEGSFPISISSTINETITLETAGKGEIKCGKTLVTGELGSSEPEADTKFAHLARMTIIYKGM